MPDTKTGQLTVGRKLTSKIKKVIITQINVTSGHLLQKRARYQDKLVD
jgi:hypothetical protein